MSLNAGNAAVAVDGEVWVAPLSAPVPDSVTFDLESAGYTGLGYATDDGVKLSFESSTDDLTGWQRSAILRTVVKDSKVTLESTFAETKIEVIEAVYGTTVDPATGQYDIDPASTGGRKRWVLQYIDGEYAYLSAMVGEVTERSELDFKSSELLGYGITATFYPVPEFAGNTVRTWDSRLIAAAPAAA